MKTVAVLLATLTICALAGIANGLSVSKPEIYSNLKTSKQPVLSVTSSSDIQQTYNPQGE